MKTIIYKQKGFEVSNPSPYLITILKMKKQREEMARIRAKKEIKNLALKIDKETMEK